MEKYIFLTLSQLLDMKAFVFLLKAKFISKLFVQRVRSRTKVCILSRKVGFVWILVH